MRQTSGVLPFDCFRSAGSSSPSPLVFGRTKGHPPSAPPQFQFVTSNETHASLYFTHWRDGGCNISHFSVEYKTDGEWTAGGLIETVA